MAKVIRMKDFSEVNGWTVVPLFGDLDDFAAPELRKLFDVLIDGGAPRLVMDLTAVGFVDSTGLNALLGAARRVRERHGALRLAGAVPQVRDVVELSGVEAVLPLFPDVAAACG
ncbi:STAS domain-containing protein [Kitasatospora sp. NPDC057904]|uniref:STAS domain-containing protein n=1 Tax=unclassified Kitasatospora TaxID=2633591 RepID=UPI0036D9AD17